MKNKLFLVSLLIVAAVYWQWWIPGIKVASDFPFVSDQVLKSLLDFPRTWSDRGSEGLGQYSAFFLWSYPLTLISGILANLGLSFEVIERVALLIPFLLVGSFAMWKMGESLKLSNPAKLIMSVFYLANSYCLLLVDGGQLSVALAYSFFPLSFLALEKGPIWAGLAAATLGFLDFRFIYLLAILALIKFLFELRLSWVKVAVVAGMIILGLNAYWLLSLLQFPIPEGTYQFFTQTSFESLTSLGHSLLLLSPNFPQNLFGQITPLRFEFILIPALALLAPILKPKNKRVSIWLIVLFVSVFFAKGSSEPFGNVYPWLYSNIPGFSLFRDSSKFFTLVALSYALLWGISVDMLLAKSRQFLKVLLVISLTVYLLFLIRPVWTDQMRGTLSAPPVAGEFFSLHNLLKSDQQFSRVLWIPSMPPLGYYVSIHPAAEALRLTQKRPFAAGNLGTYELFNFLREAPFMGEIFDVAGIGYIVYPPSGDPQYFNIFQNQLSQLPWLTKVENTALPVWQTKRHQEIFFAPANFWWVVGSDQIYNEATKSAALMLAQNAMIFVEEKPGQGNKIAEFPQAKIVLNNKTLLDLSASFIPPSSLIFPAKELGYDPDSTGWWKRETKDLIAWRYFLRDKYQIDNLDFDLGGGWAVGEGNVKFKVQSSNFKVGDMLLARVLESTRSGTLTFKQDNDLIGQIDTRKKGNNARWFEVGPLAGNELTIESEGDINVVNALAVLDQTLWESYQNKALELKGKITEFKEENTTTSSAIVSYQKINPTKYLVKLANAKQGAFLVFSQSYHEQWKIKGQSAWPVYSFLNGFWLDGDGEYAVEFEPQKYILPGLGISVLTLLVAGIILVCSKK